MFLPVGPDFDLDATVKTLSEAFYAKGYVVTSMPFANGVSIHFAKNTDSLNMLFGRCEEIQADLSVANGYLQVFFSRESWADKVVGFVVGWFCCWISYIFTVIGLINQIQLPKNIDWELRRILGIPFYTPPAYQPYQRPFYQQPPHPPKTCAGCGGPLSPHDKFCPHCGKQQ